MAQEDGCGRGDGEVVHLTVAAEGPRSCAIRATSTLPLFRKVTSGAPLRASASCAISAALRTANYRKMAAFRAETGLALLPVCGTCLGKGCAIRHSRRLRQGMFRPFPHEACVCMGAGDDSRHPRAVSVLMSLFPAPGDFRSWTFSLTPACRTNSVLPFGKGWYHAL